MKSDLKDVELKTSVLVQRTPPSTAVKKMEFLRNFFCEERSGGVAAIEQPPQDGNGT